MCDKFAITGIKRVKLYADTSYGPRTIYFDNDGDDLRNATVEMCVDSVDNGVVAIEKNATCKIHFDLKNMTIEPLESSNQINILSDSIDTLID